MKRRTKRPDRTVFRAGELNTRVPTIVTQQTRAAIARRTAGVTFAARLAFEDVHHAYDDQPTLRGVTLAAEPGEVLVIAGNGLPGWAAGENQINHSIQYGLTAWVTDLRMRDVGEIREMGFPVICNGATPETFDQEIVGMNVPVYVAGAQVRGGDIIVADDDGAVVIPIEAFNQVMVNVRDMAEKETEQERLIKSKAPLDELLAFLATKGRAL